MVCELRPLVAVAANLSCWRATAVSDFLSMDRLSQMQSAESGLVTLADIHRVSPNGGRRGFAVAGAADDPDVLRRGQGQGLGQGGGPFGPRIRPVGPTVHHDMAAAVEWA